VSVVEVLVELGGVAARAALVAATSRADVDRALREHEVVRHRRDRYALPVAEDALAIAHRLTGVVAGVSAALHWGWAVKTVPERPVIVLPRNRRLRGDEAEVASLRRVDLGPDDVDGVVTAKDRTLLDCLRWEPADSALAVADSALRDGFPRPRLSALARDARGPGSSRARWVALRADARSANSFEWHGGRAELARDARRYNALVGAGWLVLRFAWEDVMLCPDDVAAVMAAVVRRRTEQLCARCRTA
jgi:hypothetical protein